MSEIFNDHLISRLNGFELLMGSYSIAHLKLDMLLQETGYKSLKQQRLKVYLTNSLEEHHPDTGTLFASWLSKEANEANHIKRDTPVMVVLGNPPYSISTTNKSKWIENLIADYKKDLNERKINLDDDYIKFIRFGQYFIDKNGEGILSYISNNSFIDGITHRQMRKHLLESFDKIYILDLHGNSRKKETCPNGFPDQNVFDIMQGVSINIFVKTSKKKKNELGQVFHFDLFGKRELKYDALTNNSLANIAWNKLDYTAPYMFFVPKDFALQEDYDKGIKITEVFIKYSAGIKTKVDHIATDFDKCVLEERINDIISNKLSFVEIRNKYGLSERTTWEYKHEYNLTFDKNLIEKYNYRPLDQRYIYYDHKFLSRSRKEVMSNLLNDNLGLSVVRQSKIDNNNLNTLITKEPTCEDFITNHTFTFPLYLYLVNENGSVFVQENRSSNLNREIINQIEKILDLKFINEKDPFDSGQGSGTFASIDILDYIYAILHSPIYREKYKEFLKIDFPRLPYPKDQGTFWKFVKLGGELRQIHLLESSIVDQYITTYPLDGNNTISRRIRQKDFEITDNKKGFGRVWINDEQYFDKVPVIAWEFYIGGYQPAQKWLKDRHDRTLSYEDIMHYQKIIVALTETDKIMKEIDKIDFE